MTTMTLSGAIGILCDVHMRNVEADDYMIVMFATPDGYQHQFYAAAWTTLRDHLLASRETAPASRDHEIAREALAPFLNGSKPFDVVRWGENRRDNLTMTIETLTVRVTEAIAKARGEGLIDGLAEEDE
jgi:hypothetical protein